MSSKRRNRQIEPELLSPAGNWECARAAVANGADAIFFGLPKFNARLRADNFSESDLPELMAFLHAHGVKGFVTFNTLIFASELEAAREQLLKLNAAKVDAIIVQDMGLARLARAMVPDLKINGSTQMTITSPEALRFVDEQLDLDMAVLARENSLKEIRLFHANEPDSVPLEVFVHGALCVAYSGQCLTSESLGQRSANRGECAQACRMPYELVVDGEDRDLGDQRYLLSPQDLAGHDEIPQLLKLGVKSFKIEGRLKSPEYVAAVTRVYRKAIDAALAEESDVISERDRYELEMTFSRGLHSGWLNGIDNQQLVHGRYGKKRGAFAGTISALGKDWVEFEPQIPLKNGDGVVFDIGGDTNREQGGRIFNCKGNRFTFQRGKIDFRDIEVGDRVWKTDDPKLNSELRKTWTREKELKPKKAGLRWQVTGRAGSKLVLRDLESGIQAESESDLQEAHSKPLSEELLRSKLGKLGGSRFELTELEVDLDGDLIIPVSELNRLRRALVYQLEKQPTEESPRRENRIELTDFLPARTPPSRKKAELRVLCRTEPQMEAAIEAGVPVIYLDFEDVRRYRKAVSWIRAQNSASQVFLATPRIQKAGESGLFRLVERAEPDGVLIRNLGGVGHFAENQNLRKIGDFSLNVANAASADFFMRHGLENLTVSYDLNIQQVLDLLGQASPDRFELTLHQHMPMFHMEHCVFCAFMSEGTDFTNCGRPCEKHEVQLRDRVGQLHQLAADVGCRNTLFNGRAQTGARFLNPLRHAGLSLFRVELLKEGKSEAAETISTYQELLSGKADAVAFWEQLQADSRLGVTEGTLVSKA